MPRILNKRSRLRNALCVNYPRLVARKRVASPWPRERGESEGRSTRLRGAVSKPLTSFLSPREGRGRIYKPTKAKQSSLGLLLPQPTNACRLAHELRIPDYFRRILRS